MRNISDSLLNFAAKIIELGKKLNKTHEGRHVYGQLFRAGTSTGANYEESQGSPTKPDTKTKIGISLKEMRESSYFLKIFNRLKLGDVQKNEYLVNESLELKRILASILNKLTVLFSFLLGFGAWAL